MIAAFKKSEERMSNGRLVHHPLGMEVACTRNS